MGKSAPVRQPSDADSTEHYGPSGVFVSDLPPLGAHVVVDPDALGWALDPRPTERSEMARGAEALPSVPIAQVPSSFCF